MAAVLAIFALALAADTAPRVAIAQQGATLRGVKGVAVVVRHRFTGDLVPPDSFARSVIERLKSAGVPVVPYEPGVAALGLLDVILGDPKLDRVDMEFRQIVALERDPKVSCEAITWERHRRLGAEDREKERIPAEMTDAFIHEYVAANPTEER